MKEVLLGDVCRVTTGQSAPQDQEAFSEEGIPFIRAGSLNGLISGMQETNFEKINKEKAKEFRLKLFNKDTVIFAKSGMSAKIGRVYCLKQDAFLVSHLAAVIPGKQVDAGYLHRWFEKNPPSGLIVNDAYPSIKTSEVKNIRIFLPPLEEQKHIAGILDKADAIRRKRQQAIALTDQLLRSVFLDMFGDPVTNPKGWNTLKLGECTYLDARMIDPKKDEYKHLKHVGAERIEKDTGKIRKCLSAIEENLISNKFLFDGRYILYTKIRPYLRKVALPDFVGICSADIYPVRPDDRILLKEYLWFILISEAFVKYTESLPSRANIPKLNREEFARYEIMVPPIELQKQFSEMFIRFIKNNKKLNIFTEDSCHLFSALNQQVFRSELTQQFKIA
ncbi:MAG: restriction endonuclease subunit S [Nitrosomonas sp.]|uniref:restriction endonuclease subunit S n=1 Tax=Nitrosomonas sp. TaxID=42353 RepID=UPI0025E1D01C|nr:restriction endonuclease subunit S [Nitrosomonas sp.]MBY0474947.1 restriction endonuclease subunit S [Nitrosomonas sp.]